MLKLLMVVITLDPAFSRYYVSFIQDYRKYAPAGTTLVEEVTIVFDDDDWIMPWLSPTTLGYCNPFLDKVVIKRSEWDIMLPISRRELIYHELGHCMLHYGHTDGLHLMSADSLPVTYLNNNWRTLVVEFFRGTP